MSGAVLGMMTGLIVAEAVPEGTASPLLSETLLPSLGVVDDGAAVVGVVLVRLMLRTPLLCGGLDGRYFIA
jgi:hypothetical protein